MCLICEIEEVCATCADSKFECGNTQFCQPRRHVVAEDYWCPGWKPLVFYPYQTVFGGLEDDQPN